jgi:hypothetical protein
MQSVLQNLHEPSRFAATVQSSWWSAPLSCRPRPRASQLSLAVRLTAYAAGIVGGLGGWVANACGCTAGGW